MAVTARKDSDIRKGAQEFDAPEQVGQRRGGDTSLSGQLGHRDHDEFLKDSDSDFPEPDASGEHTGQK
jgi:hypothetical protein